MGNRQKPGKRRESNGHPVSLKPSANKLHLKPPAEKRDRPSLAPARSLCGPETLVGLIRMIVEGPVGFDVVRLWNDPLDRQHYCEEFEALKLREAEQNKQVVTVTTTKVRGRWTLSEIKIHE